MNLTAITKSVNRLTKAMQQLGFSAERVTAAADALRERLFLARSIKRKRRGSKTRNKMRYMQ